MRRDFILNLTHTELFEIEENLYHVVEETQGQLSHSTQLCKQHYCKRCSIFNRLYELVLFYLKPFSCSWIRHNFKLLNINIANITNGPVVPFFRCFVVVLQGSGLNSRPCTFKASVLWVTSSDDTEDSVNIESTHSVNIESTDFECFKCACDWLG